MVARRKRDAAKAKRRSRILGDRSGGPRAEQGEPSPARSAIRTRIGIASASSDLADGLDRESAAGHVVDVPSPSARRRPAASARSALFLVPTREIARGALRRAGPPRRQPARRKEFRLGLHLLGEEDRRVELVEVSLAVPGEGSPVVFRHLQHQMSAAAQARQMLQLLEHEGAHAAPLVIGVDGELVHVQRPHPPLREIARVDPAIRAGGADAALGIADDLLADLEEELLDFLFLVDLEEAFARARPLVLDGLAIDLAEDELEKLPRAPEVASVQTAHADLDRLLRAPLPLVARRSSLDLDGDQAGLPGLLDGNHARILERISRT